MKLDRLSPTRDRQRRAGTAPIEFVMALPFLAILGGTIFTVARANMLRTDSILQARHEAWHKRSGGGSGGQLTSAESAGGAIFAPFILSSPFSGEQDGSGSKSGQVQKLQNASQYFSFGGINAQARHEVYSRTWDYETIPFSPRPPLVLADPRIAVFGAAAGISNMFDSLFGSIQPPASDTEQWNKVKDSVQKLKDKINQLTQHIKDTEDKIQELKEMLANETNQNKKKELQDEIDKKMQQLKKMKEGKEKLKHSENLLPSIPGLG